MKNWIYKSPSPELVNEIASGLKVSRACAAVLVNRGFSSVKEANEFLNPGLAGLKNPFLLPDIEKAVERIKRALDNKEKILIYGDRDVDGVTSVCIMLRTLRSLGAEPLWYVPSKEGYGLNTEVLNSFNLQGVTLIITVDCGITSRIETAHASKLNMDVIVTDHHEPSPESFPEAYAVIDPKLKGSKYPFTDLAGCAVAFKVCEALMQSFGRYYNQQLVFLNISTKENSADPEDVLKLGLIKFRNTLIEEKLEYDLLKESVTAGMLDKIIEFIGSKKVILKNAGLDIKVLDHFSKKFGKKLKIDSFIDLAGFKDEPAGISQEETDAELAFEKYLDLENKKDLRMGFFIKDNLDMVSLGTIADIMPLTGENRAFVKEGLKHLKETRNSGISVLLERCSRNRDELTAKAISWNITPILNAAGRLGKADLTAKLLLSKDIYEAHAFLDQIFKLNEQRKKVQAKNIEAFSSLVEEQCDIEKDKIFVVTASGLEHGVTGIVASHIVRQYYRPVILFIIEGREAVGAVRSIEGVDVIKILNRLSDILIKYGGHTKAAGLTIDVDKLGEFRQRIKKIAQEEIDDSLLVPKIEIDAELDASEVGLKLVKEISELEPFGNENPQPVFSLKKMQLVETNIMGVSGDHVKLSVKKNGSSTLKVLGWGLGKQEFKVQSLYDIAVLLELEVYNGTKSPRLVIVDIKESV
ncbi:MAG: single-stranded-DNA-specific exonuclease RecJ [Elusimicrobia bacterium]|nr:single-stranded-DNA-specific exonuclease RecJ [Candidatus Liberimonas magnetica]